MLLVVETPTFKQHVDKIAKAIEKEAGQNIEGSKESLAEPKLPIFSTKIGAIE